MDLARSYDGAQGFPHWIMARAQTQARGQAGHGLGSARTALLPPALVLQPNCHPGEGGTATRLSRRCALRRSACRLMLILRNFWRKNGPMMCCFRGVRSQVYCWKPRATGVKRRPPDSWNRRKSWAMAPKGVPGAQRSARWAWPTVYRPDATNSGTVSGGFGGTSFAAVEQKLVTQGFAEIRAEWTAQAARLGQDDHRPHYTSRLP